MADYTFASNDLAQGEFSRASTGTWVADVYLTDPAAVLSVGQRGALSILGTTYQGTVTRFGGETGYARARVVGGAGKLDTVLDPSDYQGYDAGTIATQSLTDAGEAPGVGWLSGPGTGVTCNHWTRPKDTLRATMWRLGRLIGTNVNPALHWRCAPDGTFGLYDDSSPPDNTAAVDSDGSIFPQERLIIVWPQAGTLGPGQSVTSYGAARLIQRVCYRWDGHDVAVDMWYS